MYLEFVRELPGCLEYRISSIDPGSQGDGQLLLFHHKDSSIDFTDPCAPFCAYLRENLKWLRSIISTAAKTESKQNYRVPFTFPSQQKEEPAHADGLIVYSDGSCNENGTGGWAALVLMPDGETIELSGMEKNSTSNRMELMAALKAVEKGAEMLHASGKNAIILHTDSTYVIKGIAHRFEIWSINGFITAKGTPVANIDLCTELHRLIRQENVSCRWVRSGGGDPCHERCHYLAGLESGK